MPVSLSLRRPQVCAERWLLRDLGPSDAERFLGWHQGRLGRRRFSVLCLLYDMLGRQRKRLGHMVTQPSVTIYTFDSEQLEMEEIYLVALLCKVLYRNSGRNWASFRPHLWPYPPPPIAI